MKLSILSLALAGVFLSATLRGAISAEVPKLTISDLSELAKSTEAMQEVAARSGQLRPIPAQVWPAQVRTLAPVGVYSDRANVVIVLSRAQRQEMGLYVSLPASSWLPIDSDGWSFEHLGGGVYRFTRILSS